jgi:hypothetical protein
MTIPKLYLETGATIHNWRAGLSLEVATNLRNTHADLRERFGNQSIAVFRQTVDILLAQLEVATLRGRPALFADYVIDDDEMPAAMRLSAADLELTLEQMRDTLRRHMPQRHGELAHEYVEFALARHIQRSCRDQAQRNAA